MENLIKKTLEEIKVQKLAPEPRWKYLLRKYGTWTVFGAVLFLGAISLAIGFEVFGQLDWDLYRFVHQNSLTYFLTLLPYFWILLVGIFFVLAFFDLRQTETGYKYGWLKISLFSIGGMLVFGLFFSFLGLGGKFNSLLAKDVPSYGQHLMMTKEKQWSRPEAGFLAGKIKTISNNNFELEDLAGQEWSIVLDQKTLIKPAVNFSSGEMIKVIGEKKDAKVFQALEIRPWAGAGQGMMGIGRGMMRGN